MFSAEDLLSMILAFLLGIVSSVWFLKRRPNAGLVETAGGPSVHESEPQATGPAPQDLDGHGFGIASGDQEDVGTTADDLEGSLGPSFDPMRTIPQQLRDSFEPTTTDDKNFLSFLNDKGSPKPRILSIVLLRNGLTAGADAQNRMLKIMNTYTRRVVSFCKLLVMPLYLSQLQDGIVAATSFDENTIVLCRVSGRMSVQYVKTKRHYIGIGPGPESGLIVSRCADAQGDAGVDLISRDGQVLREIWNGNGNGTRILQGLTVIDDDILVADNGNNVVLRIAFATGLLVDNSLQATKPTHVACDDKKYVYVASSQEKTVWVIGQGNKKRALLTGDVNGDTDRVCPCGLAVKEARIIVSWSSDNDKDGSSIIEYKL